MSISPKESSKKKNVPLKLMELVIDPVRGQLYFEVLVRGEVTAKQLMKTLPVNRSTLTHHLTKFVESGVLSVDIPDVGRPVKTYRLNPEFDETIVIEGGSSDRAQQRVMFLESMATHLQVIANLAKRTAHQLIEEKKPSGLVSFVFNLLSDDEADIWNKHYSQFMKNVQDELDGISKPRSSSDCTRIVFSGIIPIIREDL
ncbi:MAG: helix-turn-helix domain-containing protein [Candidatus Thorarchaeota archaeon]